MERKKQEYQQSLHVCFVNYEKAFDSDTHDKLGNCDLMMQ